MRKIEQDVQCNRKPEYEETSLERQQNTSNGSVTTDNQSSPGNLKKFCNDWKSRDFLKAIETIYFKYLLNPTVPATDSVDQQSGDLDSNDK